MEVEMKQISPSSLYAKASGRLDIDNAADYGAKIKDFVEDKDISNLTLDFSEITFISSFGLKVILEIYHAMKEPAVLRVTHASEAAKSSFVMTGFDKFISIE